MNNTTSILACLLLVSISGCGKSASKGGPCDPKPIAELAASLDQANGIGVDLTDKTKQAEIAKAKASLTGKHFAFTGCTFDMQGNDTVSFKDKAGGGDSIDCAMKGGEAAVKAFRKQAMALETDKFFVDVSGDVAMGGNQGFERLGLRDCVITAHK
jgi:hypothetical protein